MSKVARAQLVVIAALVGLLELLTRTGVIAKLTMIPPSAMVVQLWRLLASGALNDAMAHTFPNIALAFLLSASVGLAAGLIIHAFPRLRRLADPLLASYYAVPFFVFYPLLIAVFGLNRWPLVAIGFIFGAAAVVIAALNGLDRVPPVLHKVIRAHRLGPIAGIFRVILPSAAPHLFTGMKLALAYAFIGVIAGEFILSGAGLGHAIAYAYDSFDNETMYALMLFVIALAIALNGGLHALEQRLLARGRT
jgi:NitT/TauT family transport system permease protein